jgi:hypothetical protein
VTHAHPDDIASASIVMSNTGQLDDICAEIASAAQLQEGTPGVLRPLTLVDKSPS